RWGMCRVAAYQLHPGAADGGVVLLWCSRVPGGAADAVADQRDGGWHAGVPYGQPGQVDVLAVAGALAGGPHLGHQRPEAVGVFAGCRLGCGHHTTSVSACRPTRSPVSVVSGRPASAWRSSSAMARWMVSAAAWPAGVSWIEIARRSLVCAPRTRWPRRSSRSSTLVSVLGRVPVAAPRSVAVRGRPSTRLASTLISDAVRCSSARRTARVCRVAWVARCRASSGDHPSGGTSGSTKGYYTISYYRSASATGVVGVPRR